MHNLALMYFDGRGVAKDNPLGCAWLALAIKNYPMNVPQRPTAQQQLERCHTLLTAEDLKKANTFFAAFMLKPEPAPLTTLPPSAP